MEDIDLDRLGESLVRIDKRDTVSLSLKAAYDAMNSLNRKYTSQQRKEIYTLALEIGLEGLLTKEQFKTIINRLFPE